MKIAVFGQSFKTESLQYIIALLELLTKNSCEVLILDKIYLLLEKDLKKSYPTFDSYESLTPDIDYMISVGGDGTMLRAAGIIRDKNIPVIGINTGRLGFLATVQKEEIENAINQLITGNFSISNRSLLEVIPDGLNRKKFYALNEVTISRKNTTTMITIDCFLNDEFLNTYWADGLIISTPTGSTGYSLSCNGPIVTPQVEALVLTPIAPHNLSIRPLVIKDDIEIKLRVSSREEYFLLAMDSIVENIHTDTEIGLKKAGFKLQMIVLEDQSFLKTLREKLLWGKDTRN